MTDAADIIPGIPVETHPWAPYIPKGARILFLGTFPPQSHRWAMEFYYPNPTNDFWRIMGLIFTGDPDAYYIRPTRSYRLDAIKALLDREGIALADTGASVQRLRGNASDAHLHIVKPVDLPGLLAAMPECSIIATTGEKAAATIASITGTAVPGCRLLHRSDNRRAPAAAFPHAVIVASLSAAARTQGPGLPAAIREAGTSRQRPVPINKSHTNSHIQHYCNLSCLT